MAPEIDQEIFASQNKLARILFPQTPGDQEVLYYGTE